MDDTLPPSPSVGKACAPPLSRVNPAESLLPRSICLSDSERVAPSAAGLAGALPQQHEIEG
jgi:hypothetical protein